MSRANRADVVARDKRYVWHPYTPMEAYIREGRPLVVAKASGSRIEDADGRTFLDGNSSWWTSSSPSMEILGLVFFILR